MGAGQGICTTCKQDIRTVTTEILQLLNKPKSALTLMERILLQELEIAALLCDELGPDADYLDAGLELIFRKVEGVGDGCRRILLERAQRRESRVART
jgi:hypothetical protein